MKNNLKNNFLVKKSCKKISVKRAFTVIELSIVIGVLALFLLLLYGSYFQIQSFVSQKTSSTKASTRALAAASLLVKDINSLAFEEWNKKMFVRATQENCPLGACPRLEMSVASANYNAAVLTSLVNRVSYFVDLYKDNPTLFRSQDAFFNEDIQNPAPGIPILENITEFRLEYSPDGSNWQDEWDFTKSSTPKAPELFRIFLAYQTNQDTKPVSFQITVKPAIMTEY